MDTNANPLPVPVDGFLFPNYFELNLPVRFQIPLIGLVDLNQVVFGLCGGMCFAALDYFYARASLPAYTSPKEIDDRLYRYLCERQIDSLTIPVLIKIIDWMAAGDDALAARMLKNEIPRLRRMLEKGEPAVLCLIRAQGMANPTMNHQVVATGCALDEAAGVVTFTLYDPNHPGQTPTLSMRLTRDGFWVRQSTGETLRGFFLMPYRRLKAIPVEVKAAAPARGVRRAIPHPESRAATRAAARAITPGQEPPFRLKWPVDSRRINQGFGENPAMYRPFHLAGHEGLDFFAPTGAKIYAAFDGTVYESKYRGAYGNQVRIQHEHNGIRFQTVYAHLERLLAKTGQVVKAGDIIGTADNTGNSHGSHLHLTLFIEGEKTTGYYDGIVNPWPFLEGNTPPVLPTLSGVTVFTLGEVNLRDLPSTENSQVLTRLPAGERLPTLGDAAAIRGKIGRQDQWLQVQTTAGQVGFVAAWLVLDESQQAMPPSDLVVYPSDSLPIRPGPGLGLAPLAIVPPTTPLVVMGSADAAKGKIGKSGQWLQVVAPDGTPGFVPAWLVRLTGQAAQATGLVVYPAGNVNLRAQPNTNPETDVLAVMAPEDALTVLGEREQARAKIGAQGQWLNVRGPNGMVGWIAAWLVTAQAIIPTQPPVEPLPVDGGGIKALFVYPTPQNGVNIRAVADANAARVGGAAKGDPLEVIEADVEAACRKVGVPEQWLYVRLSNGDRGWVAAWYVSLVKE